MTVLTFRSVAMLSAAENLTAFIEKAKLNSPWSVNWESARWPFPKKSRASSSNRQEHLVFARHRTADGKVVDMPTPFSDFMKAVCVNYELRKAGGYSYAVHQHLIRAGRYLLDAMEVRKAPFEELMRIDFDEAIQSARVRDMPGTLSNTSKMLVQIARLVDQNGLAPTALQWEGRIPRPVTSTVGPDADKRRIDKLPSDQVLSALAALSSSDELEARDLLRQRSLDLLACGGFRANELLTLPRDLIVEEPVLGDNGIQVTDKFGVPATRLGIRYWPAKGGHKNTLLKAVPDVMVEIAKRAIADILRITEPFAAASQYMAANPGRALFGGRWDSLPRDAVLELHQVASMLGLRAPERHAAQTSAREYLARYKIPFVETFTEVNRGTSVYNRKALGVHKRDVEAHIYERSSHESVLGGLALQRPYESLFVVPLRFFDSTMMKGIGGSAEIMSDQHLYRYVAGSPTVPSVFERYDLRGEDGEPLRITSHQFRHWLNTLAQEGGLSEHELARWMGRKDIRQNRAYDHSRPRERALRVQEAMLGGGAIGPLASELAETRDPVRRQELVQSAVATVHITDVGMCTHDWSTLPCPEYGSCETCFRLFLVKGDAKARADAEWRREQAAISVAIAEEEKADGTYGVDNWLLSHKARLANLDAILAVHDDPDIPDETLVQLTQHGWSVLGGPDAVQTA